MMSRGIVIVGGGQSAAVAAQALREHGYRADITLISRERHLPYERPPLSKAFLVSDVEPRLSVLSDETWAYLNVKLKSSAEAVALNLHQQQVRLDDSTVLDYDKCLIATGGEARGLALAPAGHPQVHYIRTLDDARRLRKALKGKPRVAILGGGFLGLEVANSAVSIGAQVVVLERADTLLDRFLPMDVSAWLATSMRNTGIEIKLGVEIEDLQGLPNSVIQLKTSLGNIDVDQVVVAIGLQPNDSLARVSGLAVAPGGGILVNEECRTSNEHVFASGDCTSQLRTWHPTPIRLESWQNANDQARTAAAAILGKPLPSPAIPWFWTDQGTYNIQMLGVPTSGLTYVRSGDPNVGKAIWIGHKTGVPVHGVAVNAGAELRALRPLFETSRPVSIDSLPEEIAALRGWIKQLKAESALSI